MAIQTTVADPTIQVVLADAITDAPLADITNLVTAQCQPRISRPMTVVLNATQADDSRFWSTASDGHPYVSPGDRLVKIYRNGTLIANTELWRCDWAGDENRQTLQMTCFDSMIRTPMRTVRDDDGRLDLWKWVEPKDYSVNPQLPAGPLVQRLMRNSHGQPINPTQDDHRHGDDYSQMESWPSWFAGPRVFPIDYESGDFSASANCFDLFADGPIDLGTFIYNVVADTGICDIVVEPTETALGADPGITGVLNVVDLYGSDKSATVHFDYGQGDNSIKEVARSIDMSTVVNRLRYFLGPKRNRADFWAGSIDQPINANQTQLIQPLWDDMFHSRERFGVMFGWHNYDSDASNTVRWLFHALFNTEIALRIHPRELISIVPSTGCPFKPFDDYNIGDIVSVNLANIIGPPTAASPRAQQRIYGFDVEWDVNGVETVTQIYNSADATQTSIGPA